MEHRHGGFDHVRTYQNRVAISQPYEANGEQLAKTLVKLAGQDIRVRVWGISPYYPGYTFSLVMWHAESEALAHEVMEKMHAPFEQSEQPTTGGQW
jgi:hypothetical protein